MFTTCPISSRFGVGPHFGWDRCNVTKVGRLFYTHSQSHGWTSRSRQNAWELLVTWRVRLEESVGPNSSPLEHVASIHFRAFFFGLSSVKVVQHFF